MTGPRRWSSAESAELIARVEEEHDLLRHEVDGWSAWAVVRRGVQFALSYAFLDPRTGLRRADRLALALSDARALARLGRRRLLVKSYTSGLAESTAEGRFRDIWFDDLIERVGGAAKLESVNNADFLPRRRAAAIPADLTSTLLDAAAGLLEPRVDGRDARAAAARIHAAWRASLGEGVPFTEEWVAGQLTRFSAARRVAERFLRRARPEQLLVADPGEHALVAAARERGIRTAELQHGFLNRDHASYSWGPYARAHRARLPIPERLLLYGEHWRQELAAMGFWDEELAVVGSSRVDRYRRRDASARAGGPLSIVLTTQGVDVDRLVRFVSEFLRESSGTLDLRLLVKLHPVYDVDREPYLRAWGGDDRVSVYAGSDNPSTFELLARADLHLSVASTCHYDAIGLGVPTAILPLLLHDKVLPLHAVGHAHLAETPARLAEIAARAREERVAPEVAEHYFRPGATENIARELGLAG